MKKILNFIDHLECPSINGIIFPNEAIQLFNIDVKWDSPNNYSISVANKTSISILENEGNLWCSCAVLTTLVNLKHSIEVIGGEGNYGSDGFVGVIDQKSRKLKWLAFFACSNPFNKLEINDDEIHAFSTVKCVWKFKLLNPIDFHVGCF